MATMWPGSLTAVIFTPFLDQTKRLSVSRNPATKDIQLGIHELAEKTRLKTNVVKYKCTSIETRMYNIGQDGKIG